MRRSVAAGSIIQDRSRAFRVGGLPIRVQRPLVVAALALLVLAPLISGPGAAMQGCLDAAEPVASRCAPRGSLVGDGPDPPPGISPRSGAPSTSGDVEGPAAQGDTEGPRVQRVDEPMVPAFPWLAAGRQEFAFRVTDASGISRAEFSLWRSGVGGAGVGSPPHRHFHQDLEGGENRTYIIVVDDGHVPAGAFTYRFTAWDHAGNRGGAYGPLYLVPDDAWGAEGAATGLAADAERGADDLAALPANRAADAPEKAPPSTPYR